MEETVRLVTDGACLRNPGADGWAALIVRGGGVEEYGGYEADTTNNRMELQAVVEGLRRIGKGTPVVVVSDSTYLLNGITKWLPLWKERGWQTKMDTPVLNRDLWEQLDSLNGSHISWEWTRGHAGDPTNERADFLARAFARRKQPRFTNKLPVAVPGYIAPQPVKLKTPVHLAADFTAHRPTQITYLSLVDSELQRHFSWEACNKRVSGVFNAKFKKCASLEEEMLQLEKWEIKRSILETESNKPDS